MHITQGPHLPHADHPAPADERLTGPELLALQLVARGYSSEQVARLLSTPDGPHALLASATRTLGAHSLTAAVTEARRRRLID